MISKYRARRWNKENRIEATKLCRGTKEAVEKQASRDAPDSKSHC